MSRNLISTVLMLALGTLSVIAQVSTTRPQPLHLPPPAPEKHQPPSGPQTGTISGYVYWDSSAVEYNHASPCQALTVAVSVGTAPNGAPSFEQFKPFETSKNFTALGNAGSFAVCAYTIKPVPVNMDVQLQIGIAPSAFAPSVSPMTAPTANNPNGPIRIPGGSCDKIAPSVPSPAVLGAQRWTCGNYAYNVNFLLQPSASKLVIKTPQKLLSNSSSSPTGAKPLLNGPGAQNPAPAKTRVLKTTLSSPKQGRKIANHKASLHDAEIIAVLKKQRQAADMEATQMKLRIRPAGLQGQPLQTQSATGQSGMSGMPAARQASANAVASSSGRVSPIGSEPHTQLQGTVLACSHDPGMRILNVNGQLGAATFTQDSKYNFYTITGCSFGDPGPNAKIYIYYHDTFRQDFQIQEWNDNWIKLNLNPNLTGVNDHDNLTLVVQRADGKQASKGGFKFYGARVTTLLPQIPQQYFGLNHFRPDNALTASWKPTYTSGSSPSVSPNLPGLTAEVHWDAVPNANGLPVGGTDMYDFKNLQPSFALDSTWMEWRDVGCDNPFGFRASHDSWNVDWYGASGIQVTWQAQLCIVGPRNCGQNFTVSDCFVGPPESNYGINVWVTGPRGVDPWSGKPTGH